MKRIGAMVFACADFSMGNRRGYPRGGRIQLWIALGDWIERSLGAPGIRLVPLDAAAADHARDTSVQSELLSTTAGEMCHHRTIR